jgi:hypothetical protein
MKADLDDLESVKVTGRRHHLKSPKIWKARWQGARLIVLCAFAPLVLFGVAMFMTHCPAPHR